MKLPARLRAVAVVAAAMLSATPLRAAFDGPVAAGPPGASADAADTICLLVEAAALGHGVPVTFFSLLIRQESSFRPMAQGPVTRSGERAQGIAQFMPGTAAEKGLADPFDPVQALPRSAQFLAELRVRFGNWGLAAAAYNAGPGRMDAVLRGESQVPFETRSYVAAVTGHDVDTWIAARRAGADLAMAEGSCAKVRASLHSPATSAFMAALEKRVEAGLARPWGVQLSAGFSRARALAAYDRAERRFSAILAGREPMILRLAFRSRGTRAFYQVRAGTDTRAEADSLCNTLRRAGGACLVLASAPPRRGKRQP